ncbi:hypothetical protein HY772_00770 [Candidatus Woesearchaeota archaeon]|nr:hypothetical protein [Candidatus Woesearchaeota archaeon]
MYRLNYFWDPGHSSTRGRIPKGMPSVAGRIIHKKHDCITQITTEDGERRGDAAKLFAKQIQKH